jgi:hypothetical protein
MSFTFFSVKILLKAAHLKKKFTTKANKSKKEEKKGLENKNFFAFFAFAVKISSKT